MKKISTYLFLLFSIAYGFSQSPQRMTFQAVIRNNSSTLLSNQPIGIKISILQGSASGTVVFSETQSATTNTNGLVTLQIGGGSVVSGDFSTISWANGPFFIQTETDVTGGTNYSLTATTQLLSVPYALYAETSGSSSPGPQGIQGLTGNTGAQGLAGTNGTNGQDGLSAYQIWLNAGNTGTETQFLTSLQGATGAQGIQGLTGTTGAQGMAGSNGTNGQDGLSAYQIWLNAGNTGTESQFLTSIQGATGAQGIQGLIGNTGAQGLQGPAGANGQNGLSAYQIWLNAGNTGTELQFLTSLQGATGTQGIQGLTGNTGAQGIQGPIGPTGAQGNNGTNGAQGPMGLTGATGAQGIQGIKGDTGLTGAQGPIGLTGATGPQGIAGTNGVNGSNGSQGPIGLTGSAGPQGSIGLTGATGAVGATGLQGIAGVNGTNGTNGQNGKNTLVNTTTESAGANCANGGTKVEVGLDANLNNILDVNEVNSSLTKYVCNGASTIFPVGPTGAILYSNGSSWVSLNQGNEGQVLTINSGLPSWSNAQTLNSGLTPNVNSNTISYNYNTSIFTINGALLPGPSNTDYGFVWSTSPNPTIQNNYISMGVGTIGTQFSNTLNISQFVQPNTTYYFKAYASNNYGISYGQQLSFITAPFTIGQNYQGGKIAYLDNTGQHGFIISEDLGNNIWGCTGQTIGGTSQSVGSGLQNSIQISNNCSASYFAAKTCLDYVNGIYDDWYLPSSNELLLINFNYNLCGIQQDVYYNSSSEATSTNYFGVYFSQTNIFSTNTSHKGLFYSGQFQTYYAAVKAFRNF